MDHQNHEKEKTARDLKKGNARVVKSIVLTATLAIGGTAISSATPEDEISSKESGVADRIEAIHSAANSDAIQLRRLPPQKGMASKDRPMQFTKVDNQADLNTEGVINTFGNKDLSIYEFEKADRPEDP